MILRALPLLAPTALLALGAALVFNHRPPITAGADGSLYVNVAGFVADGLGLRTSVSMYHEGLDSLPAPSSLYPLWPLVLGAFGSLLGLDQAAFLIPRLLYLLDLLLVYVLVRRVAGARYVGLPLVSGLLLALSPAFFRSATAPYTEPLAFALLLGALLAVHRGATVNAERPRLAWAATAGLLAGLAYLTRFQMIAAVMIMPLIPWPGPRRLSTALVATAAGLSPAIANAIHLATIPGFSPTMLLDFASHRSIPALPPLIYSVKTDGPLDWLRDRASGLLVAFHPKHPLGYPASFGVVSVLVPAALVVGTLSPLRRRIWAALGHPGIITGAAAVLLGAMALAPVHTTHLHFGYTWLFGWRHGLPFLFLLIPALALFHPASYPRLSSVRRRALATLLATLLALGFHANTPRLLKGWGGATRPPRDLVKLARWLDERPQPTVALTVDPQFLSALTRSPLQWTSCWDDPEYLPALLEHVHVDLAILRDSQLRCRAFKSIRARLTKIGDVDGFRIFRIDEPEPEEKGQ